MRVTPSGYMTCREMFDRIGRERHAADWIGDIEYRARSGLWTIEEEERAKITPGSGMSGSGAGGISFAVKREDVSDPSYQAERAARVRYEDVFTEFLRRLECSNVKAVALDTDTGKLWPVPADVWRTSKANRYLTDSVGPAGDLYRSGEKVIREGLLLIAVTGAEVPERPRLELVGRDEGAPLC